MPIKLSDARRAIRAEIETHDGGHMAINVKYYGRFPDGGTDSQRERVWDAVVETWWESARDIARESGYDYVHSAGRSGGWIVPFWHRAPRAANLYSSPGQGGRWGYPSYPDADDLADRVQFLAFTEAIEQLLADVPAMLADELRFVIEQDAELDAE